MGCGCSLFARAQWQQGTSRPFLPSTPAAACRWPSSRPPQGHGLRADPAVPDASTKVVDVAIQRTSGCWPTAPVTSCSSATTVTSSPTSRPSSTPTGAGVGLHRVSAMPGSLRWSPGSRPSTWSMPSGLSALAAASAGHPHRGIWIRLRTCKLLANPHPSPGVTRAPDRAARHTERTQGHRTWHRPTTQGDGMVLQHRRPAGPSSSSSTSSPARARPSCGPGEERHVGQAPSTRPSTPGSRSTPRTSTSGRCSTCTTTAATTSSWTVTPTTRSR